jgi:hypothetical protein
MKTAPFYGMFCGMTPEAPRARVNLTARRRRDCATRESCPNEADRRTSWAPPVASTERVQRGQLEPGSNGPDHLIHG